MEITNKSSHLVVAVSKLLDPEAYLSQRAVDCVETYLARGAHWLSNPELLIAAVQLAYAARLGEVGTHFSDSGVVVQLCEKACEALEVLVGRSRSDAVIAKKAIREQLNSIENDDEFAKTTAKFQSDLRAVRDRLERVITE